MVAITKIKRRDLHIVADVEARTGQEKFFIIPNEDIQVSNLNTNVHLYEDSGVGNFYDTFRVSSECCHQSAMSSLSSEMSSLSSGCVKKELQN